MIILFSGCDKVKGFNTRIKEVINKEIDIIVWLLYVLVMIMVRMIL